MSNEHNRLEELFWRASQLESESAVEEFLVHECGDDVDLLREVQAMLEARTAADEFAEVLKPTSAVATQDMTNMVIGPYKLREEIGEGGMGVVYAADQKTPVHRRVAIKIIKPGMDSQKVIARFEAERQTLALMDHPNIARILDAGTSDQGLPYFVMELVNGVPITQYCDERKLTVRERLELIKPVCRAVHHAHQKGIIHRDLKPSNILVTQVDGSPLPKVIDFGIAKAVGSQLGDFSVYTEFGMLIGTLEYMSPEQAQRNQRDIDTRSDVYSLGVVLYELLAGTTPFEAKRLRSAALDEILKIISSELPPQPSLRVSTSKVLPDIASSRSVDPGKLAKVVRGELDWIVMKSLDKERDRRYDSAAALGEDVARYLDSLPVNASPPTFSYRMRKLLERHRAAFVSAAAIIFALSIGIILASWQAYRATHASIRANEEYQRATELKITADREKDAAIEARNSARVNLEFARAMRDFLLKELLGMVDPAKQVENEVDLDPNIKVVTLVERAITNLDKLDDQPEAKSSMEFALGKAIRALGKQEEALRLVQHSYDYLLTTKGEDAVDTLIVGQELGWMMKDAGQSKKALEILEGVSRKANDLPQVKINSLRGIAECYRLMGELDKSIEVSQSNLRQAESEFGKNSKQYYLILGGIWFSQYAKGELKAALENQNAALDGLAGLLGAKHPLTVAAARALGATYLKAGQTDKAVETIEPRLNDMRTELGEHTLVYQASLAHLAWAYGDLNQPSRALHYHELAYETAYRTRGKSDLLTVKLGANYATSLREAKGLPEAIEFAKTIAPLLTNKPDEQSYDVLKAGEHLLNILIEGECWEISLQTIDRLMNEYDDKSKSRYIPFRLFRHYRAECLGHLGKVDAAADQAEELLNSLIKTGAPADAEGVYQSKYAMIVWRYLAKREWTKAADAFSSSPPRPDWKFMEAITRMGDGDFEGSKKVIRTSLDMFGKAKNPAIDNWLCLMGELQPIPPADQNRWREIALRLISEASGANQRRKAAGTLLRCGEAEKALQILEGCQQEMQNDPASAKFAIGLYLRMALANLELGKHKETKDWLQRAEEEFAKTNSNLSAHKWNLTLFYEVIRAEILERLKEEVGPPATNEVLNDPTVETQTKG